MNDTLLDLNHDSIVAGSRKFPEQSPTIHEPVRRDDMAFLSTSRSRDFCEHCFDENGHS